VTPPLDEETGARDGVSVDDRAVRSREPEQCRVAGEASLDFTAFYETYHAAIFNYVRRMLPNQADAEDLTVTAFEKALRAWGQRPPDHELRPWLFRIATNACLDELRHRQRLHWQPWDAFLSFFHPSQIAGDDTEATVLRHESARVVRKALDQLSPRDRAALVLRECQGFSVEEVGQAIGTTTGTAKVVLFRARERFRVAYRQVGDDIPASRSPGGQVLVDESGDRADPPAKGR
jgi:RNA polymerase sigma-70 factor (ECF subfamily)